MKMHSVKGPRTTKRERAILDSYYEWAVEERSRLWSAVPHGDPELDFVCRQVTVMQLGREVDIPDEWIAAREATLPKEKPHG